MAKIKDLLNITMEEFAKMNVSELKKIVRGLGYRANSRIKRLNDAGFTEITEGIKKFSTKGNLNQLRAEFIRAKRFLEKPTSSVRGAKNIEKAFFKKIGMKYPKIRSPKMIAFTSEFWSTYRKLQELFDIGSAKDKHMFDSGQVIDLMKEQMDNISPKTWDNLTNRLSKILEKVTDELRTRYTR